MKKLINTLSIMIIILLTVFALNINGEADSKEQDITILFTHDLHSHLLPTADENGGEYGGYARLMTAINEQKSQHPDAILVDGGDFSMGSLFQTAFATDALDLRIMGAMGYDATTLGNHEFDYYQEGLASMLNAAVNSGDRLPALVEANYKLPQSCDPQTQAAFDNYGINDYTIIEKGDTYYAVFGIMGSYSDECAPNSNMELIDPIATAQATVEKAVADCQTTYNAEPIVICLSHSGTDDGKGEDYELAKAVDGIDVIVSAHTHTSLSQPIKVNDTYIVSAGEYGKNLGVISLSQTAEGELTLNNYQLIAINQNIEENQEINQLTEQYKQQVNQSYLAKYNMTFDQVLVNNPYQFETVAEIYGTQHESTVCNLYTDAYKWAAEQALGEEIDVAATAAGVIRESLPTGDVTVANVFNIASIGVGTEGELISAYITGKDIKNVLEVDASLQSIVPDAQIFTSGLEYSCNTHRMIFNKVDYAMLRTAEGTLEEIQDDQLYRLATGMYCGQMLGIVESSSFGLLSVTLRDENGNPIAAEDLENYIIRGKNGEPLKEWYAIATYLQQMGGTTDSQYSQPDGRKVVYSSLNPVKIFANANQFTYIMLAVILLLIILTIVIIRIIRRRQKRKQAKK